MIYDILPVNNYDGNGTTTTFDFDFYVEATDELKVYFISKDGIQTLLTYDVDYSINELRNTEGSYITFPLEGSTYETLKEGEKISLQLHLPISQETQYNNSSLLNLSALEHSFDYLTRLIQIISRRVDLCVKTEEGSEIGAEEILANITSLLAQASDMVADMKEISDKASEIYEEISDASETIINLQNSVDALQTSKLNVSGSNFPQTLTAIDGEWVFYQDGFVELDLDNNTINIQRWDISTSLPIDDYDYEVMFTVEFLHDIMVGNRLYFHSKFVNNYQTSIPLLYVDSSSKYQSTFCTFPVGNDRALAFRAQSINFTLARIRIIGYRRLGTNK